MPVASAHNMMRFKYAECFNANRFDGMNGEFHIIA